MLGVEFFSNIFIKSDIYISPYSQEHARRFPPGFGRSPNPGLAGDSKPRGGGGGGEESVKPDSGGWPSAWAICWWLARDQLSKAAGRGGCLARTPPLS